MDEKSLIRVYNEIYNYHKSAYDPKDVPAVEGVHGNNFWRWSMLEPLMRANGLKDKASKEAQRMFLDFAPNIVNAVEKTYPSNYKDSEEPTLHPEVSLNDITALYSDTWTRVKHIMMDMRNDPSLDGVDAVNKYINDDWLKANSKSEDITEFKASLSLFTASHAVDMIESERELEKDAEREGV